MATRFYFPSTGTAAVSPAFDANWDDSSAVTRRPLASTLGSAAFIEVSDTETSTSNAWDILLGQFVSEPLKAQTLTGSFSCVIRAREDNAAANARSQMVVKIVSGDGTTVRATLCAADTSTTVPSATDEWIATTTASAARTAFFPAGISSYSFSNTVVQAGDRLVVEVGARVVNTVSTSYTVAMRFGNRAAGDYLLNQSGTSSTDVNPWIEFSSNVALESEPDTQVVSFQTGVNGYDGTLDTQLREADPNNTTFGTLTTFKIDGEDPLPQKTHGLLRFNGIFGTGAIPLGSTITSAYLTLNMSSNGDEVIAYNMLVDWSNTTTWTSIGGGVKNDGLIAESTQAFLLARSSNLGLGTVSYNVTASVQKWSDGQTNYGWGFTEILGDGLEFSSSEAVTVSTRPKLTVLYTPPAQTALSGSVASTFGSMSAASAASRTIPTRSGSVSASLKSTTAAATGFRTIPTRSGAVAAVLGTPASSASASRTIPTRSGTVTASFKSLTAAATSSRTIPTRSGAVAASLNALSASATASRTIPAKSGATSSFLVGLLASATANRTIPTRSGAISSFLVPLSSSATAARLAPDQISGVVNSTLPPLSAAATGARSIPTRTGSVTATLGTLTSAGTAVRMPAELNATAAASFGKLSASAVAARLQPGAKTAVVTSTLGKLESSATAGRMIPTRSGAVSSSLGKLGASGVSVRIAPARTGAVSASFASLASTGIAVRVPSAVSAAIDAGLSALKAEGVAVRAYPGSDGIVGAAFGMLSADAIALREYPTRTAVVSGTFKRLTASSAAVARPDYSTSLIANVYLTGVVDYDVFMTGIMEPDLVLTGVIDL